MSHTIEIGKGEWTKKDIGQMILRTYEDGEISTGRAYELLEQLFAGRKLWNYTSIWANVND